MELSDYRQGKQSDSVFWSNVTEAAIFNTNHAKSPIVNDWTRRIIVLIFHGFISTALNVAGTVANVINIVVFAKMGFAETINISLLGLAVSDLLALLTLQWLNLAINPLFKEIPSLPFNSHAIAHLTGGVPHLVFERVSGYITAYIALERCLCVTVPLKVRSIFTPKLTICIITSIYLSMFVCITPIYMGNYHDWNFDPTKNRSMLVLLYTDDRDFLDLLAYSINNANCYLTFVIVITCTAVLVLKLRQNSKWRKKATSVSAGAKQGQSSTMKDRKIVLLVVTVSAIFIACLFPRTLLLLAVAAVPDVGFFDSPYENIVHSVNAFLFFFETVNTSVNIVIYLQMSTKFRIAFFELFGIKKEANEQ